MEDGKNEKKMLLDFEPSRPPPGFIYKIGEQFFTGFLEYLLEDELKFGYVVADGNCAVIATLQGNEKTILHKVNRKGKHNSESSYKAKVAELANQSFLDSNRKPIIKGLVLAGCATFKTELARSGLLDPKLLKIILGTFVVS